MALKRLDAVHGFGLSAEMAKERLGGERAAGDSLAELVGAVAATVLVDVLVEPLPELDELALADLLVEVRDLLVDGFPELGGVEVPKRVCWEIANEADGPVNVLKTAAAVVGDVDAQVVLVALVPSARQVLHF